MVKKKGQSKRTTLKDKYRVQRRVVETNRKRRKQTKKDIASGKVIQKKKDPGIPNSWPFKQELLQDIARTKERQQEQQRMVKEQRKQELLSLHEHQEKGGTARSISELMDQANADNAAFAQKNSDENVDEAVFSQRKKSKKIEHSDGTVAAGQQSRRAYLRELKKVIDNADVILQILDARDPVSTRMHPLQEESILSHADKRMVLVLNKIDLVPKTVVASWLTALRRSHPTIAVKACGGGATTSTKAPDVSATTSSVPVGMDGLLQLLKNYARIGGPGGKKHKSTIVVGIVGYPNTGKSSIINALKRCRAVGVSARPGFTTCMQEVALDTNVRLLDSPGVVFDDKSAILGNCVDAESLEDPIAPISDLLQRANHASLLLTYNIPTFSPHTNVDMFLALVAKSYGRVMKGGISDKSAAARSVLRDWNCGKIPYYTLPPASDVDAKSETVRNNDAVVVSDFSPAFDISKFDDSVLQTLEDTDEMDCVQLSNTVPVNRDATLFDMEEEEDDEMDDDGDDDDDQESAEDYDFNEMMK
jgi:nuclear GTP-binding protein